MAVQPRPEVTEHAEIRAVCAAGKASFCRAGEAAEEAFKRQFENDFDLFLRLRAREFAVNGLLFVVMPGSLGSSNVGEGFFTAFNNAAQAMCHEGHIDSSLLADCMFPIYLPTEDVSATLHVPDLHAVAEGAS